MESHLLYLELFLILLVIVFLNLGSLYVLHISWWILVLIYAFYMEILLIFVLRTGLNDSKANHIMHGGNASSKTSIYS